MFGDDVDVMVTSPSTRRAERSSRSPSTKERIEDAVQAAGTDSPIRAAVGKLSADQARLLVDVLEGFETRRELLEWQQDLAVHALGQLDDEWFTRSACHSPTVSALLDRPWGTSDGYSAEVALEFRRAYVAEFVLPAFHEALKVFRWAAVARVEHLDDENEDAKPVESPDRQQFPAMRPELGELNDRQEWALGELLDGFDDAEALLVWGHQVTAASYAEIDSSTVTRAYFERPIREHLCGPRDDARARFMRESWAAKYLLPSFNRAAAALAQRATEVASTGDPGHEGGSGSIS
ncbi:hypothetical protein FCF25_09035 [Haloprofundus sp. MHR1]|nr:hypothetical protein FCF25_09035 [Haloprofundus sp. MHR1]